MRKIDALQLEGNAKKAIGNQAIAGSGPMTRRIG